MLLFKGVKRKSALGFQVIAIFSRKELIDIINVIYCLNQFFVAVSFQEINGLDKCFFAVCKSSEPQEKGKQRGIKWFVCIMFTHAKRRDWIKLNVKEVS